MNLRLVPGIIAIAILGGCTNFRTPSDSVGAPQSRGGKVSQEAERRKERSISILRTQGVPYISHLPVIETETEAKHRTTEEVALRAMALCIVAVKGEGAGQDVVKNLVRDYNVAGSFSPIEKRFIEDANPSKHDRVQFSWRYECYWVMLWALGFVDNLRPPDSVCDVPSAVSFLRDNGRDGFIRKAKLRSVSEILDEADLIYRYHWAVVDARVNGREAPSGLDAGVVMERHYALNWLIGYMDQDWDDISTDT